MPQQNILHKPAADFRLLPAPLMDRLSLCSFLSQPQAGHIDGGKGTVQAIVALKDGTAPTRVYTSSRPYEGVEFADSRASRTPQARNRSTRLC